MFDHQVPYRPYILSGAHIVLENEFIPIHEHCSMCKETLPNILLEIQDFDFSGFVNDGNMVMPSTSSSFTKYDIHLI